MAVPITPPPQINTLTLLRPHRTRTRRIACILAEADDPMRQVGRLQLGDLLFGELHRQRSRRIGVRRRPRLSATPRSTTGL
jgi:hypothetical protein